MKIRFLADADLNHRIVLGLLRREPSIDCLGAQDGGTVGLSDPEVLVVAAACDRILLSHDYRTMPQHYRQFLLGAESPGLILIPQALSIGKAVEDLLLIWSVSDASEWRGRIDYLPL